MTVPSRRARTALTLTIVMLLVGGASALWLRQGPTAVTTEDALKQFRSAASTSTGPSVSTTSSAHGPGEATAAAGGAAPAAAAAPDAASGAVASAEAPAAGGTSGEPEPTTHIRLAEEGVYTFLTEGYEWTSALGGARHDYPKETASTVRHGECGWIERWQPLRERWDESLGCPEPGGFALRRFTTYHEFFQRGATYVYECPAGSIVWPRDAAPGHRWQWSCSGDGGSIKTESVYRGVERIVIGGTTIEVDRVHYESVITGDNEATMVQDRWLHRDTGLVVQIHAALTGDVTSPFGRVRYEEHYRRTLKSLTPQR